MAGDWIKMRVALERDPQIARIWRLLCESEAAPHDDLEPQYARFLVIGALHALWVMAQDATETGVLEGVRPSDIDDVLCWPGFAQALQGVGWLHVSDTAVGIPAWDKHNGTGAKNRATNARRMQEKRA